MPIVNPTAETHPERFGYRLPQMPYIGRNPKARRLLELENKRDDVLRECATEIQGLLDMPPEMKDLYTQALPEVLAAVLESHDSHASDAAAIAYLRKRGYQITDKTEGY
jgi:hypothetical protein